MKLLPILLFISLPIISAAQKMPLLIWFDKPATQWEESLPLGNGRLGMMPDGGIQNERLVLNDITLWSGSRQDANNYNAWKQLPAIRELLAQGKNDEAQKLIDKEFVCLGPGSGGKQWGCFQLLANLDIEYSYDGNPKDYTNYRRYLSLDSAIAATSFDINGINYQRNYFTSFDDDAEVIQLTANKAGQLNFSVGISRPERGTAIIKDDALQLSGQLDNGTDGRGMQYLVEVRIKNTGGQQMINGNKLTISNANSATIFISAATDFKGQDHKKTVGKNMTAALQKDFALQRSRHITAYRKLFNRLNIDLGKGPAENNTIDRRLAHYYHHPENDPGLPALFFQFGRYLSISSTRVGLLPPNLQGLWANQTQTPWNGDYHLDVNVQMNHWAAELSNLPELNLPLTELVRNLVEPGKKTAKAYYNAEGWVSHVITNVWGFTEPGESASWGITKAGSGWLCNNLWQHYEFTNSIGYLKSIYPILRGSAQFYNSILVKHNKTGWLVTSPSSSPENTFYLPGGQQASICEGASIDNQIVREIFTNVITASEKLGVDELFRKELRTKLSLLPPVAIIASNGRIQEWLEDYKETDPQHRHISHLYALFPGKFITADGTPELAAAAKKTLDTRGDDGPGWSIAYKQLFWARLHDGNRAFKLLKELLKPTLKTDINYGAGGGVYPNLLAAGPPFQIDANFGAAAGIGEMLIQSHAGYIELLPAIPDIWKPHGKVSGLKARGNFAVDMEWNNGRVVRYTIKSPVPARVKVKVNGTLTTIMAAHD